MIEYREPPFNRVWVTLEKENSNRTGYGLDKDGREVTGWIHHEALHYEPMAREFLFRELADIVMDEERHYLHAMSGPKS